MRESGVAHQPAAVLHQHMSLIAQLRTGIALAIQPRIRFVGRGVRVVLPSLSPEICRLIALPAATGWRLVLRAEALVRGPGLQQRAVHREVFVRHQTALLSQHRHFVQKLRCHRIAIEPITVLGEHRVVPERLIDRDSQEPAKQQVVLQLLHQQPLAADRVEQLQQLRTQQLLRGDRRPSRLRVERREQAVHPAKSFIDQGADLAQRMIVRNEVRQRRGREQQDPGDPAQRLRLPRRGLPEAQDHRQLPSTATRQRQIASTLIREDPKC